MILGDHNAIPARFVDPAVLLPRSPITGPQCELDIFAAYPAFVHALSCMLGVLDFLEDGIIGFPISGYRFSSSV